MRSRTTRSGGESSKPRARRGHRGDAVEVRAGVHGAGAARGVGVLEALIGHGAGGRGDLQRRHLASQVVGARCAC
jgi:hypothetical protein